MTAPEPKAHCCRRRENADRYEMRAGPKWPCIAELLAEHAEHFAAYDCVWFPDDDLSVRTKALDRMFAFFQAHELHLAQPVFTRAELSMKPEQWSCSMGLLSRKPEQFAAPWPVKRCGGRRIAGFDFTGQT